MIDRRQVLAGGAALALLPSRAQAAATDLRATLDAAQAQHDPEKALRLLAPFDATRLAPSSRLDLLTARAGLAVDADIVRRFAVDPRAKGPPLNPAHAAALLRRKFGEVDARVAATRLDLERRECEAHAVALFDRLGLAGATTGERFSRLWHNPHNIYSDADTALADMNAWNARFRRHLPTLIGPVPSWCLNVAALTPTAADIAARHYGYRTLPTPTTPGGYIPDLRRLADRPRWTMPSVVAHELLPGHMLQLPLEAAADPHPLRLEYAPGFTEGWGIYAEAHVAGAGLYEGDPRAELGWLHWRLFRIGRALIDLAIHLDHLPVEQAKARLVAWHGEPAYFAPFDMDLARIAQEPMTRAAEMLGSLAIEDNARGRSPASLRRYHALVLDHGRMRSDELALTNAAAAGNSRAPATRRAPATPAARSTAAR